MTKIGIAVGTAILTLLATNLVSRFSHSAPTAKAVLAFKCAAVYQPAKYEGGAEFDWWCQRSDGRCRTTYASNGDGEFFEDRYYYSRGCIIRNVYIPNSRERFDVLQRGVGSDIP